MRCLLFEGSQEGKGQLVLTIQKSDGTRIGEGPCVWLDLKNIKKMYQRSQDDHFAGKPWDETDDTIVFVHGWNMSPNGRSSFAETFYKRLWHRGFKGRFAAFQWETDWSDSGNGCHTLVGRLTPIWQNTIIVNIQAGTRRLR